MTLEFAGVLLDSGAPYPDRVLHQFGYPPLISTDPDIPRDVIKSPHWTIHANYPNKYWNSHYWEHYDRAANMSNNLWLMPGVDGMQFQGHSLLRYQAWYLQVGMTSVYLEGDYGNYLRSKIFKDDGYIPIGRKYVRNLLVAIKGAGHSIICLGKRGYIAFGHTMLNLVAPCIEDHDYEANLVTMLRDTGENIDCCRVQRDDPDAPPVMACEMPPSPESSQSETTIVGYWACPVGTASLTSIYGRPVLPKGPAYMPSPPEPHEHVNLPFGFHRQIHAPAWLSQRQDVV